jgi:hypothetical protein
MSEADMQAAEGEKADEESPMMEMDEKDETEKEESEEK